jgi:Reverse transcriptase (RNA-dependent DNA polymerase)
LLADFAGLEHTLTAETSDAEALEPHMLVEAKCHPDWPLWEKAIDEELATLRATGTWRFEEALPRANVIGLKWVFKVKKDTVRNVTHYKACLVAQRYSQIRGINYNDTYAPMAKLASSHAIIAMANQLNLELHQVNIKGVYLNGVLTENKMLYMQHPPGYKLPDAGGCILRLVKTLYGLKQSGQHWYQRLTEIFTTLDFTQCSVDQAVFYRLNARQQELIAVAVHVNNCTITATSLHLVNDLKDGLWKHVEVTDLRKLHWMLGIKVKHD